MDLVLSLLPWVLPVVLGAAIGFITNKIAIKMLFRPLNEKRIFGLRVPFTPGIIPKQRHEFAESIGRMVSRELLTPEVILKQTRSEAFRRDVEKGLSSVTEKAFTLEFKQLIHHDPSSTSMFHADAAPRPSENELRKIIASLFYHFIRSNSFSELLRNLIYSGVSYLADLPLSEVVTDKEKGETILRGVIDRITSAETKEKMLYWLDKEIDSWFSRDIQVRAIIPKELVDGAAELFNSLYPDLVQSLAEWMREEDTKAELVVQGKIFIRDALEKLRGLQKFFIRAGGYHSTLEEKMPEIVDNAITIFYELAMDEVNREGIVGALRTGMMNWRRRHLKNALGSGVEVKTQIKIVAERIFTVLEDKETKRRIYQWITIRMKKTESVTLGKIMEDYLQMDQAEIADGITNLILQWITSQEELPGGGNSIGDTLYYGGSGYFRDNEEMTIGDFFGIHQEVKSSLDHYMTIKIIEIMEENVPDILQTFDVYSLVVDKINELVIEDVEKLLMMVIEKQLKWINIFGAILGGIIGVSQIIVNSLL